MKTIKTYPVTCPSCRGTGFQNLDGYYTNTGCICPACHGSKWVTVTETTEVSDFIYPTIGTDPNPPSIS